MSLNIEPMTFEAWGKRAITGVEFVDGWIEIGGKIGESGGPALRIAPEGEAELGVG